MRTFLQYFAKSSRGNDCCGYGTDSDGDNNNNSADEDKNDGDGNDTDGGSNSEGGSNGENDAKDSGVEMMMLIEIEMMMLIYKVIMVLKANYCNPILLAFPQLLMRIYQFLVQLYVNNLCIMKMCRVIRLYKPSYNISLSSIFWFHLYRMFIGNHLPSRFYFFA